MTAKWKTMTNKITVTFTPAAGIGPVVIYEDIKEWDYSAAHGLMVELNTGDVIMLNASYVVGLVYNDKPEEENE